MNRDSDSIKAEIASYVISYTANANCLNLWRTPLVGFADAAHPYVRQLPNLVSPYHLLPEDILKSANTIISYFIPFTPELAKTNRCPGDPTASAQWVQAYNVTNDMIESLNLSLAEKIRSMGYEAVAPENVRMLTEEIKSNWSQRHIAYAAGLGTFGLNNMLITQSGCCGRLSSILANIPVTPDEIRREEACLFKQNGSCMACVKNCFSGALTQTGYDRRKCYDVCMGNMAASGADVCGKCVTGIPCESQAPGKKRSKVPESRER